MSLEHAFAPFREKIVGIDLTFTSPFGEQAVVYADWTASGRLYRPIEDRLSHAIGPYVANTHTETSFVGITMTKAYHEALHTIKQHVNAAQGDAIICYGSGMTAVINKFQRILGLRVHEQFRNSIHLAEDERPVVFITHMEHHSNQTSWLETLADVYVIGHTDDGLVDLYSLRQLLNDHQHRKLKIAAVTSCSNVTGIFTPYHEIAEIMHEAGGVCFVDFACSAPYINIDMHPAERPMAWLDAIFFSPHKFLGGPGSSGVLIFNTSLYHNRIPDNPGGGTVNYTNPWGHHQYVDDIEAREDGGTPGFLQAIRTALCIKLKDAMGVERMLHREEELIDIMWDGLRSIPGLHLLADQHKDRLGVFSFFIEGLHYNLGVQMLNDRYGIQARGGCSCAGTYGHYLLEISHERSGMIADHISVGNLSDRPGWIRLSIHPTMTDAEAHFIVAAVRDIAENFSAWSSDYSYVAEKNVFVHRDTKANIDELVHGWFDLNKN